MKILHTADWHIGKWVNGYSMLEDQRIILQQMLKQIERERPDVILIAGDLYDRSIPPLGAVELLNETLSTIVSDFQIPVIAIAGNHDSNTRLQFGSRLLKASGLHLIGVNQIPFEKIKLQDSFGDVIFYPIAYMDPLAVAQIYKDETIRTHEQAMAKILKRLCKTLTHLNEMWPLLTGILPRLILCLNLSQTIILVEKQIKNHLLI